MKALSYTSSPETFLWHSLRKQAPTLCWVLPGLHSEQVTDQPMSLYSLQNDSKFQYNVFLGNLLGYKLGDVDKFQNDFIYEGECLLGCSAV